MEESFHKVQEVRHSRQASFELRAKEEQEAKIQREQRKKELEEERERSKKRKNHLSCLVSIEDTLKTEGDALSFMKTISTTKNKRGTHSRSPVSQNELGRRLSTLQDAEERRKDVIVQVFNFIDF